MKRVILSVIALTGFTALAVFGFLPTHDGAGHVTGCVASAAAAAPCPVESGSAAVADFHINALKTFSTAIPLAAMFLALIALAAFFGAARRGAPPVAVAPVRAARDPESPLFPLPARLARWLSLHENSPSFR